MITQAIFENATRYEAKKIYTKVASNILVIFITNYYKNATLGNLAQIKFHSDLSFL